MQIKYYLAYKNGEVYYDMIGHEDLNLIKIIYKEKLPKLEKGEKLVILKHTTEEIDI